jgi:hypothetical protein
MNETYRQIGELNETYRQIGEAAMALVVDRIRKTLE